MEDNAKTTTVKRKYNNEKRLKQAKLNQNTIEDKRRIIKGYNTQPNSYNLKPEYHKEYYQKNKEKIYKRKYRYYHYKKEASRMLAILCDE
ncbi:hypothetical protein N8459_02775 [Nitrosopumilus sp.]|nr:hypothetical protein [Nitrosopumilus sp.]